ncbi:MAG TPA: hypothetical protein VGU46_10900 [Acidobacteriaceae bacterium]|nr:hypothetical protein [Acidobacteriaceae bacterium]
MMHSILVGVIFVAMVLAPCIIALYTGADDPDAASEPNVLEDGFI